MTNTEINKSSGAYFSVPFINIDLALVKQFLIRKPAIKKKPLTLRPVIAWWKSNFCKEKGFQI